MVAFVPRIIACTILITTVSCTAATAKTNAEVGCSSYEAVYTAPQSNASGLETTLTVDKSKEIAPGAPIANFILETRHKGDTRVLSKLKMTFACDGEGNYCQTGYSIDRAAKAASEQSKSFPVVALNRDFSRNLRPVSGRYPGSKDAAPYALIFSNFAEGVAFTAWAQKPEDIEYFTEDKTPPQGSDVWILKACKH